VLLYWLILSFFVMNRNSKFMKEPYNFIVQYIDDFLTINNPFFGDEIGTIIIS